MFSRAVDPKADAGRIAAVLTRTTIAVAFGDRDPGIRRSGRGSSGCVYGSAFSDAGVALV